MVIDLYEFNIKYIYFVYKVYENLSRISKGLYEL